MVVNAKGIDVHGNFVNNNVTLHCKGLEGAVQACPSCNATFEIAEDTFGPFVKECNVGTVGTNVKIQAAALIPSWCYGTA